MAERYADLTIEHYRLLDGATDRDALTVVAPISSRLDAGLKHALIEELHTDGTIGIRLPYSWVERQISSEIDRPITTAAIRYPSGDPVRSFDDAIAIVIRGLVNLDSPNIPIVAIRHPPLVSKALSTVVGIAADDGGHRGIVVYREGDISYKRLISLAGTFTRNDVDEWT